MTVLTQLVRCYSVQRCKSVGGRGGLSRAGSRTCRRGCGVLTLRRRPSRSSPCFLTSTAVCMHSHPCHICAGTGLTPATSAPPGAALGSAARGSSGLGALFVGALHCGRTPFALHGSSRPHIRSHIRSQAASPAHRAALAGERVKRFDIQCCTAVPGATSGYTPWCDVHQEVVRDVTAERTIGTAPPQPTRRPRWSVSIRERRR